MDLGSVAAIAVGLVLLWMAAIAIFYVLRPREVGLGEAVAVVPDLVRLIRDLLRDPATPLDVRVVLVIMLIWIVSPIDLIPEFIPVLGPLDDVVVAVLVLRYVRRQLGEPELRRRWSGTPEGFRLLTAVLGAA